MSAVIDLAEIADDLKLNPEDGMTDFIAWKSAWDTIETYLGYELKSNNVFETTDCRDGRIILASPTAGKIERLTDLTTKEEITEYTQNKRIIRLKDKSHNKHELFAEYPTGYTRDTIPAQILQTAIELFRQNQQLMVFSIGEKEDHTPELLAKLEPLRRRYL